MRRRNEVVEGEQRCFRVRLDLENVEGGTRNFPAFQSIVEIRLIDDAAASAVHEAYAILHARDRSLVDEIARGISKRHMHRDEIGLIEYIFKVDELEAAREMRIRIDIRIVRDHVHSHCLTLPRHFAADPAEADHTESFT